MTWTVLLDDDFVLELAQLSAAVRTEIIALTVLLREEGPQLGRPHADTLKGSRHANMKELRVRMPNAAWRVAFAFDPERQAIVLVAGDKSGMNEKRFYRTLITKADERFDRHLEGLKGR